MATALRRHQLSLTGFIHPPRKPLLTPEESQIARSLFKTLINYAPKRTSRGRYKPAVLIEETFEYIQCKDAFLDDSGMEKLLGSNKFQYSKTP
jgi:hypothetical protein